MKSLYSFLILCVAASALSACVTKHNPAQTEVYYPGVGTVKYHCPPGHRKKGNCY